MNESQETLPRTLDASRREFIAIVITWCAFAAWVIGYVAIRVYPEDATQIGFYFGLPSWVFWGIGVPWLCATVFTVWFCLQAMRDHPVARRPEV